LGVSSRLSALEENVIRLTRDLEKERSFTNKLNADMFNYHKRMNKLVADATAIALWAVAVNKACSNRGIVKKNIVARIFAKLLPFLDSNGIERDAKKAIDIISSKGNVQKSKTDAKSSIGG